MGLNYADLDNMTLYEFRLYQQGYKNRMTDLESMIRWVAYYSLIGPGMVSKPPEIEDFWPIGDEGKKKSLGEGTQKWSQAKRNEFSKRFTEALKDHKW